MKKHFNNTGARTDSPPKPNTGVSGMAAGQPRERKGFRQGEGFRPPEPIPRLLPVPVM